MIPLRRAGEEIERAEMEATEEVKAGVKGVGALKEALLTEVIEATTEWQQTVVVMKVVA